MSMLRFIKDELKRANFDEDDRDVLITICNVFFSQFDSGGAVHATIPVLHRLLCGLPLSPLTGDPEEWFEPIPGGDCYQNRRCASVFQTHIDIPHRNLKAGDSYDIAVSLTPIKFPYMPPSRWNIQSPVMEFRPHEEQDRTGERTGPTSEASATSLLGQGRGSPSSSESDRADPTVGGEELPRPSGHHHR